MPSGLKTRLVSKLRVIIWVLFYIFLNELNLSVQTNNIIDRNT